MSDLHTGNVAFEIPDLDGKPERTVLSILGTPRCVPVLTRDQSHQSELFPKYLVVPASLEERVNLDDLRVKIIDFGDGSSS